MKRLRGAAVCNRMWHLAELVPTLFFELFERNASDASIHCYELHSYSTAVHELSVR